MRCLARRPSALHLSSIVVIALAGMPAPALAHLTSPQSPDARVIGWSFDGSVVTLLSLSMALYVVGALRLHSHSHAGRRHRRRQAAAFGVGWLMLVAALVSPLDQLGSSLFSAHMLQHELLMIVAAPLLVMGRPLAVWLWAFPAQARMSIGRAVRNPGLATAWSWPTRPIVTWVLHAVALWAWHVPSLFEAALREPRVHTLQHWSFLVTALLFWWTVFGTRRTSVSSAQGLLLLFTTMMHTSALGALLTLAPGLWYPSYAESSSALGFDPLQDQQLGGLVMWVPGALAYVIGGLAVAARWLVGREPSDRALPILVER